MPTKITLSLIALFIGSILPLAFAPFGYYPLAIIAPTVLLFLWNYSSPRQAFFQGWLFGIGFFSFGVYWVYMSIHHYGNAPAFLAGLIVVLLVLFLALYPALCGFVLNKYFAKQSRVKFLIVFPALWAIFEWLRGWVLTGFPWLFLGYSQIDSPLRGIAPIFGVYGISFFVCFTAGVLVTLFLYRKQLWWWIAGVSFLVAVWGASFHLAKISWTTPVDGAIKVSLIQGNVSQEQKWDPKQLPQMLANYAQLTRNNWSSRLIVWPEAAIPAFPEEVHSYLQLLTREAKKNKATILFGTPVHDQFHDRFFNGVLAIGVDHGYYFKRHLVPFGEFLPFKFLLIWLHNFFTIPMSDFSRGPTHHTGFIVADALLAPFICYEIAYPGLVLRSLPAAHLLLTVSDDSWFGKSIAAAQHLEIAQMRSLETGRFQMFVSNTGITAIINDHGEIVTQVPQFKQVVLTNYVRPMEGATPWVSFGHDIWLLLMLVGIWVGRSFTVEKKTI